MNNTVKKCIDRIASVLLVSMIIGLPYILQAIYWFLFANQDSFEIGISGTLLLLGLVYMVMIVAFDVAWFTFPWIVEQNMHPQKNIFILFILSLLGYVSIFCENFSAFLWHLAEVALFFFLPDLLAIGCVYFLFYLLLITLYFFIKKHVLLRRKKS